MIISNDEMFEILTKYEKQLYKELEMQREDLARAKRSGLTNNLLRPFFDGIIMARSKWYGVAHAIEEIKLRDEQLADAEFIAMGERG